MKPIKVAVVSAVGFSAMVAVVAGVQTGSVAVEDELKAEAVADAKAFRDNLSGFTQSIARLRPVIECALCNSTRRCL